MSNLIKIDCAILSHEGIHYVCPTISLSEIISLTDETYLIAKENETISEIHRVTWKNHSLPLVTFDLMPFKVQSMHHEKIAIMNAFFSVDSQEYPYIAVYFNGTINRKKISVKTIRWSDSEKNRAEILEGEERLNVTIIDMFKFSKAIEQRLSQISKTSL